MFSFFRAPIRNTTPQAQVSVQQIYKYITGNYAKLATERLRSIADHGEARRYKAEMFDYVTFSGCFSTRQTSGLIEHSGFLCFDIDKLESEDDLQNIKAQLITDERLHTVLLFRSPSGNGLKWVVEVPDRHWLTQNNPHTEYIISHGTRGMHGNAVAAPACRPDLKPHTENMSHTDNILHTELTDNTEDIKTCLLGRDFAQQKQDHYVKEKSSYVFLSKNQTSTASSNLWETTHSEGVKSVHSVREKENSVRDKNYSVRNKNNSVREEKNDVIVKNHRALYERIRGYLFDQYGIETDHTSDIARPCYLGYDDDAFYDEPTFMANPAHPFLLMRNEELGVRSDRSLTPNSKMGLYDDTEVLVRAIEKQRIDITSDYHNWIRIAFAIASKHGISGEEYFHRISQFHPSYDPKETHKVYQSCLQNNSGVVTIATIVYLMRN